MKNHFTLVFASLCAAVLPFTAFAADIPIYLDPKQSTDARIDDLLSKMTLEEKISQITDDWGCRGIPRLKVPALIKTEGLHGNSYGKGATVFPHAIALAATWNLQLATDTGKAVALEAKSAGIRQTWSPVLDVVRDARWGRVEETFGEDPYMVGRFGVAWIDGFQKEDMIATPKHFAGHGAPQGGRDSNDVGLSEREMREVQLVPFRAAILESHAGGVMAAYGTWNGVPDNASKTLLQGILREEWEFDGMVVTDCGSIEHFVTKHSVSDNFEEASKLALDAGVDIECGAIWRKYIAPAVQTGYISEASVDAAVRPMLAAKFKLGLFENPGPTQLNSEPTSAYDTPEHRALARETAVQSMVLVKNMKNLLPLSKSVKTIAVIGPNAASVQTGDYSPKAVPGQLISVLEGIKNHVSATTKVVFATGFTWDQPMDKSHFNEAIEAAKQADVVVMVMGDSSPNGSDPIKSDLTTGENKDGATLEFPGVQEELIQAVQAVGKPVVLDVVNGKPFVLTWENDNIPAILISWYGGEEAGNATADLLFGDRNPSGRLPITFPRHVGQLPLTYDYKTSGRAYHYYDMPFEPLYRFGFGMSYTTFKYSNLQIASDPKDPGFVTITADVQNTGSVDGDEVAQLYLTDEVASVVTRVIELKGFSRISLKAGETKSVKFQLTPYDLSLLNEQMVRVVEPGVFRVHVGGASPTPPQSSAGKTMRAAGAEHKQMIGFKDPAQGVTGEFNEPQSYAARFVYSLKAPAKAQAGQDVETTVTVKNEGNLTDVGAADLYKGKKIASWHFELNPGQTKTHKFRAPIYEAGAGTLSVVGCNQLISQAITVDRSPAKLTLSPLSMQVSGEGMVQIKTTASDTGSDPYDGQVNLSVDGKQMSSQPVAIQPGEKKELTFAFQAEHSGNHKIQLGDLPVQNLNIVGGIEMAWGAGPALFLPLNEGAGAMAKDIISGKSQAIQGTPQWDAESLMITGGSSISVESIDLANRSFTLAAWIKIDQYAKGDQIGIFGGHAPMGAGQDDAGSKLHVGVQGKKLRLGFFGRDVQGNLDVPVQKWINVAYTYDVVAGRGTLYLNGNRDAQKPQKPYEGALETIGTTPMMKDGKFSLKNVAVINGCLSNDALKKLAENGLEGIKAGSYQSEWRPLAGTLTELKAFAQVPAGSEIQARIEVGDGTGKVIDSKNVSLSSDVSSYPIAGMKSGPQVRIRTEIKASKWDVSPSVDSYSLKGENTDLRWITASQWKAGTASGGVRIEDPGQ